MSLLERAAGVVRRWVMGRQYGNWALRSGLRSAHVRSALDRLYRNVPGHRLDVGCGGGDLLGDMATHGVHGRLIGVDRDRATLLEGKAHWGWNGHGGGQPSLVQADARALPFRTEAFDLVTCANMLLMLPTEMVMRDVLAELTRVCRRGGTVAFDIRNRRHPVIWASYPWVKHFDATCAVTRLRAYTPEDVRRVVEGLPATVTRVVPVCGRRMVSVFIVELRKE